MKSLIYAIEKVQTIIIFSFTFENKRPSFFSFLFFKNSFESFHFSFFCQKFQC